MRTRKGISAGQDRTGPRQHQTAPPGLGNPYDGEEYTAGNTECASETRNLLGRRGSFR